MELKQVPYQHGKGTSQFVICLYVIWQIVDFGLVQVHKLENFIDSSLRHWVVPEDPGKLECFLVVERERCIYFEFFYQVFECPKYFLL